MKVQYVEISKLKPHEKISRKRLADLTFQLKKEKLLRKPIIVERDNFIILDGHHRVEYFKKNKIKKIPAILVDYDKIKVLPRRKKYCNLDIKKLVTKCALEGKVLPYKTTKHILSKEKIININFKIIHE